ncbi:hypothetical protein RFI_29957 [Reticulomyxa filosa]|uniref:RanBP2-type domain-containing protein n=1 Tax=Reticulomyxa filosa TaxID=46433 RepID=X6M1H2_RETFI|nr:hypothetical protein RFI_29957 [Reticulomyxa filosa]|eukprot:ETO07436.1 hypothetical protein RFI_29957 [Reticulomyxa filosa]
MNSQIEKIREEMISEYHKDLLEKTKDEHGNSNGNNGNSNGIQQEHGRGKMHRIASEVNTHYYHYSYWHENKDEHDPTLAQQQPFPVKRKYPSNFEANDKATKKRKLNWNKHKNNQYRPQTILLSSSSSSSVQANGTYIAEHWSCGKCKYLNLKQRAACDVCNCPREQSLGGSWKCLLCEHLNEGKLDKCAVCEHDRRTWGSSTNTTLIQSNTVPSDAIHNSSISDSSSSMTWVCATCMWQNSHMVDHCSQCDCPKESNTTNGNDGHIDAHDTIQNIPLLMVPVLLSDLGLPPRAVESAKPQNPSPENKVPNAIMDLKNTRQNFHRIAKLTQGTHVTVSLQDIMSSDETKPVVEMQEDHVSAVDENEKEKEMEMKIEEEEEEEEEEEQEQNQASRRAISPSNLSVEVPSDFKIDVPTFESDEETQEMKIEVQPETKDSVEIHSNDEHAVEDLPPNVSTFEEWNNLENKEELSAMDFLDDKLSEQAQVTPAMILECKQLLDMFGIPYIVSPAEAEAQCAELNRLGLVDGVVTDDSDVFLFDGQLIYRHLFHMDKNVEQYKAATIRTKMGLSREKLIGLAMLLGSDYTEGIKGIGIVNGVEIIQAFCNNKEPGTTEMDTVIKGLQEFRDWIYSPVMDKKPLRENPSDDGGIEHNEHNKNWFKWKHRNIKKHWYVSRDFPSEDVIQTYWKPLVDSSLDKFEFGKPQVEQLKTMCYLKFCWDIETVNKTLEPVVDTILNKPSAQKRLESYMHWSEDNKFTLTSKRAQKAIKDLTSQDTEPSNNDIEL